MLKGVLQLAACVHDLLILLSLSLYYIYIFFFFFWGGAMFEELLSWLCVYVRAIRSIMFTLLGECCQWQLVYVPTAWSVFFSDHTRRMKKKGYCYCLRVYVCACVIA